MSRLINIRNVSDNSFVQIPNEVLYGEDAGIDGELDFIVSRAETTANTASWYGRDTADNKLKLTFTNDQQYEYVRVFENDRVSIAEDLVPGDLIIVSVPNSWDLVVGKVVNTPRITATEVVVGLIDAESKARNYRFRRGELVEGFPEEKTWDYHSSMKNKKALSVRAAKYRDADGYRQRA